VLPLRASLGTEPSKGASISIGKEPVVLFTLFAITIESLSLYLREREQFRGKKRYDAGLME
jgi:hypothetical protein